MRYATSFVLLMALLTTASAGSMVHRCVGSAGEVVFSQTECGATAVPFELRQAQAIGEGLRASERAWLDRRAGAGREATAESVKGSGQRGAEQEGQRRYRCERTRQRLEALRAERRRGYKAGRGATLRERQAGYEAYLASFCS